MRIEFAARFRRSLKGRSEGELDAVQRALDELLAGYGRPHAHAGLGIRKLKGHWFECRVGLQLRLAFLASPGVLTLWLCGTHDEIRAFLKKL